MHLEFGAWGGNGKGKGGLYRVVVLARRKISDGMHPSLKDILHNMHMK
jgi:hypothetical protein